MAELINIEAIAQLKDLMGEKYSQLLETYTRSADKHIASITAGYASGDADAIVAAAHPLKSASGNMGLEALSELAEKIEETGKQIVQGEQELSALEGDVQEIASLYEEAKAALLAI